ncbi:MAG TPA: DNA topoisomerase I [Methanothermococcus okinawensis]|uniref:DNA topoisomerase 1 n=1 Tax=Methanothermococcus okinawensis TaxID=155863 RepID=A0A832YTD7_9EURY|nr:DNA topoisomerase I [Methanothermococcus okinawensis]
MTDLIICEKPNVAKKIANALGKPKKLFYKRVPYYELERNGKKIIVASAVGHLFTLKESNKKNKKFGEYPVFDIEWVPASTVKGMDYVKNYIDTLKKLSREADEFYIATDWDIEGELIGYHALYYCCGKNDAKRMRFSSLTKEEIIKAYENPDKIDYGLIDAGDSRHKLDWYYGINVSRALMQSIMAVNRWQTMSTGRVQGPALSFLVDRELEIKNFVPKPYWVIGALLKDNITAIHERDKFWDEKEAKEVYNKIKDEKEGIIEKIKKTKKKIKPNPPFDLGTLQREAHRIFKFSPKKTQEIAQKLYEKGLCLHPDTRILTPKGTLRIKELEHEGSVLCLNKDLKIVESKYKLLKRTINENLIRITLEDNTSLIATKEHPILTYSSDRLIFVPCEKLREGDNVLKIKSENGLNKNNKTILYKNNKNTLDRTQQIDIMENIREEELNHDLRRILNGQVDLLRIVKMEYIPYNGEVYDLTVETYHNFIANNVIVHNCSYPRTSSQKLPEDKEYIKKILYKITAINDYKKYAEVILKSNREPIQGKKKDPAHPAIHFVDVPNEPLPDEEKKLYDLIVRRTLSLFWEDAEREYVNISLNIKGEIFKLSGSRTIKEGWHEIYYFTKFDEKELPNLRKNDRIPIEKITLDKKETKPPKRYTMASIIKELENRQLGTKCLTSDTLVKVKINDKIENLKIEELFEMLNEKFCKNNVEFATNNNNKIKCISYDENGNSAESEFEFISRRKLCDNERVYKIEFNDGSYIETTDEHPILIYDDNEKHIKYVRTKDLDNGMKCIYSIKYSDKEGKIFCNWDEFIEKCSEKSKLYGLTDEVKELREKLNLSKHKFSEGFGISYIQAWKYEEYKRIPVHLFNKLGLKKPEHLTSTDPKVTIKNPFPLMFSSSLVRIISHLVGDGSIDKKKIKKENVYDFRYHNTDIDLITQFVDDIESVFGIRLSIKKEKPKLTKDKTKYCKTKYYVKVPAIIGRILAIVLPEIIDKNAPKIPKEFYPEYIGALFDDKGCVSENEGKVFISNTNFDLLDDVRKMLLDLGIESRLDKNQFKLYIKGRKNIQKFLNNIPFISVDKKQKLINALSNNYTRGNEEGTSSIVWKEKAIIMALGHHKGGLTSKEISDISNLSISIVREYLKEFVKEGIVEKITLGISEYPRKKIVYKLKSPDDLFYKYIGEKVINKDFITKTISNIIKTNYNGYVYDIVNSKYSSFIANGIVVHNSTRADIVEKLVKRGYVIENNSLQVTDLGIAVIETLKKYCPEIIDEKMTRELEKKLDRLQKGTIKKDTLLKNAEKKLRAILEEVKKREKDIGRELVEKIDTTNKSLKTVGKCKCGGDLLIIKSKENKRFIGCSNYPECSITYPLPQKGRIKILNETCEICGSPMIAINKQRLCINPECPSKASQSKEEIEKSERICPKCGGKLTLKKGIYGMFYGCENYPKCRYVENLNKKNNSQDNKKIVGKCPKCGGELIVRSGRFGEFIGCSNYPKCKYTEKIKSNK